MRIQIEQWAATKDGSRKLRTVEADLLDVTTAGRAAIQVDRPLWGTYEFSPIHGWGSGPCRHWRLSDEALTEGRKRLREKGWKGKPRSKDPFAVKKR